MSRAETGLLTQERIGSITHTGYQAASPPPPSQRPRHPFDSPARLVLSATLVVGGLVAGAPAIPLAVRAPVLFAALVAWAAAAAWGTAYAVRLAASPLRRDFATAATVLGGMGVAAAVLLSTQLEIIRTLQDRPALTWNIDWRFHLNHAQAIARFGGVDSALDYAGAPVAYHVGPAWLAGVTERVLGRGVYLVSFGILPLLCVLTIASLGALTSVASASGPAPHGKEIVELSCEGLGPVTVAVPRSENNNGAGQLVGQKGHGIPVSIAFTLTDITTNMVLTTEVKAPGNGHAHPNQQTTACSGIAFEAPASTFFGGGPLPPGVSPTDIIQGSILGQIIVKK